jgi:autophagy-related protein 18
MSFSLDSQLLSVSSDSENVHVFKLDEMDRIKESPKPETSLPTLKRGSMIDSMYQIHVLIFRKSPLASAAGAVSSYIPDMITDIWEPARDFASAKIPSSSKALPNLCAFCTTTTHGTSANQLLVVTADGFCYTYALNSEHGGECVLQKKDSLVDTEEDA